MSSLSFSESVLSLSKIGQKRYEMFQKLGISTVGDLLTTYPRSYIDYTSPIMIADAADGESCVVEAEVVRKLMPAYIRKGMTIYKLIVTDGESSMTVTIYNSQYMFDSLCLGDRYLLCGRITRSGGKRSSEKYDMSSPSILNAAAENRILPVYPLTDGLTQQVFRMAVREALQRAEDFRELLPATLREQNSLCCYRFALENIHFPKDREAACIARNRLIFEELYLLALGMRVLKSRTKLQTAHSFSQVSIDEFYASLPFELTRAQKRSIAECCEDMMGKSPMNRLLQGDVGSGKTAVAAACACFSAKNGYQTALMAPTEILAAQHYKTLSRMLQPIGISVCLLTGSMPAKQKTLVRASIASGDCLVAVGTHALFQKSVDFLKLGLVITDEQHRFGVNQRAELARKGSDPHRLIMSATPIPRTLALMMFGDMDISVLDEMPTGRLPIKTYAFEERIRARAFGFVRKQLLEGRQCYIVCPAIEESEAAQLKSVKKYAEDISNEYFRDFRVGLLHGKMPAAEKESVMKAFEAHKTDILVSTTVVEVGVDVPNASVMVIENAERFGLSQLHQLRGRVGRGRWQSYCLLVTKQFTPEYRQRLETLVSTNDGFKISEEDLKLRGPGEFFGERQHGLPKLKIADMTEDMDVMRRAQSAAEKTSREDPMLEKPENECLKKAVQELFSRGADL